MTTTKLADPLTSSAPSTPTPPRERTWITSDQLSALLRISTDQAAALVKRRKIRSYRFGHRTVRIDMADVEKFIKECGREAVSQAAV